MRQVSTEHGYLSGTAAAQGSVTLAQDAAIVEAAYRELPKFGVHFPRSFIAQAMAGIGMDDVSTGMDALSPLAAPIMTPSITTPIQFLQAWLPGFVKIVTAARKADELIGISTVGAFEDEEVVQGTMEPLGYAQAYTDAGNVPLASWNSNFERRTVVRFEMGARVGVLEEMRAARMRVSTAAEKRNSAALQLEIVRNDIAFYGYNGGNNRTYGYLNDPTLPAYIAPTTGVAGDEWADKDFLEIVADIRKMAAQLQTQSGDLINPEDVATTLGLATAIYQYLSVVSDYGISVRDWIRQTYPKMRVVSAPELNAANGGDNVAYLHADSVPDSGSDDGRVFIQMVPSKFMALGVEKLAKGYVEDYANATAGVLVKRPYGVARMSGL